MPGFRYIGPEDRVKIFGATFARGEPVDVTDAHAASKLAAHAQFEAVDETVADATEVAQPKRRGRPPKVRTDANEA